MPAARTLTALAAILSAALLAGLPGCGQGGTTSPGAFAPPPPPPEVAPPPVRTSASKMAFW